MPPDQFYEEFVQDFKKYFQEFQVKEIVEGIKVPDYDSAKDENRGKTVCRHRGERVSAVGATGETGGESTASAVPVGRRQRKRPRV